MVEFTLKGTQLKDTDLAKELRRIAQLVEDDYREGEVVDGGWWSISTRSSSDSSYC